MSAENTAAATNQPGKNAEYGDRSRWFALVVLCVGMLMIVLDVTPVGRSGCSSASS